MILITISALILINYLERTEEILCENDVSLIKWKEYLL